MREIIDPADGKTVVDVNFSYSDGGLKTVKISNNLSVIDMGSGETTRDVYHARIGKNVKRIGDCCFMDFENLVSVDSGDVDTVGDRSFYGCKNMKQCSLLAGAAIVGHVGSESFSGTIISSAVVNTYRDSTLENYSDFALANMKQLKSVQFRGHNPNGNGTLSGCENLISAQFLEHPTNIGKNMFRGCSRLSAVSPCGCVVSIGDDAFNGCGSLSSIDLMDSGLGSYHSIGNNAFSGTMMTELTLPETIKDINAVSDCALSGMSDISSVTFSGINMYQFLSQNGLPREISIQDNMWLVDAGSSIVGMFQDNTQLADYDVSLLKDYARVKRIPLIVLYLDEEDSIRSRTILNQLKQRNQLNRIPSRCSQRMLFYVSNGNPIAKKFIVDTIDNRMCRTPVLIGYKNNGETDVVMVYDQIQNVQSIANKIAEWTSSSDVFGSHNSQSSESLTISSDICETRCFGSCRNMTLYFKDKYVEYDDTQRQYMMSSVPRIDNITTDDFRYSQWYRNARHAYEYAYSKNVPILTLFADGNTTAGKTMFYEVFKNKTFQQYVLEQKIILCFVYVEEYDDVYRYCINDLLKFRSGQFMHLSFNQKHGITWNGIDYQSVLLSRTASYKQHDSRFDDVLNNVHQILEWVGSILEDFDFEEQSDLVKPQINKFQNLNYDLYENQKNDDYGRYYPSDRIEPPEDGYSYEISVLDGISLTKYTLREDQTTLPPPGTYRYYTMSQADSRYVCDHDLSGIIFKIDGMTGMSEVDDSGYGYGEMTYDGYLMANGITGENILRQVSSVFDEIYPVDEEGNISKHIIDYDWGDVPVHNSTVTLYLTGISCETESGLAQVDVVELMMSGDVETHNMSDDIPIEPCGVQYVVHSEKKRRIYSRNTIANLSVFHNQW